MNTDDRLNRAAAEVRDGMATITPSDPRRTNPLVVMAAAAAVVIGVLGISIWMLRPPTSDVADTSLATTTTMTVDDSAVVEPTTTIEPDTTLAPGVAEYLSFLDVFQLEMIRLSDQVIRINDDWEARSTSFEDALGGLNSTLEGAEIWASTVDGVDVPASTTRLHEGVIAAAYSVPESVYAVIEGFRASDDGSLRRTAVDELLVVGADVRLAVEAARAQALAGGPEIVVATTTVAATTTTVVPENPSTTAVFPVDTPEPINGWERVFWDSMTFGAVSIADSVAVDGTVVAVGCTADDAAYPGGPPAWVSSDAGRTWSRAAGPSVPCLDQIVATPFGLYAANWQLLRSTDGGVSWEPVIVGEQGTVVDRMVVTDDGLVLITSRASLNESREAEVLVTSDGETWQAVPADVFDTSDMLDWVAGEPGYLVVGASPGGEATPTAAVWGSSDGLDWRIVTPDGPGFYGARMTSVTRTPEGFVAVGYDYEATSLMAAWTSPDGITWTRSPAPRGDEAARFGFMGADAVTYAGGELYAIGTDFDADRDEESRYIPAIWSSPDGVAWVADISYDLAPNVPFFIADGVGFWPPRGWVGFGIDNVVQVFARS